ncbi:MAG: hypothetical protein IJA67_10965 [Oscillospiraceae bacterium]|jgi:hypothetical protein|nr:hypothetical protein [Oscillospiraceae bacterium]
MDDLLKYVPNVYFEKIPIKNLVSNQDYQRNLSQSHIERAAENFDLYQINPVKVSRRDGINYVFNGQHTIEIVALVSGSRETPVWCMIYDDLSYSHEADIFANQMKFVKALVPYEVFMANIEAGNEDQLMIRDLVESYGMTIGTKRVPGNICAVSTLESIYNKYGYHVLNRVLRLIIATWEGDVNSFSANVMNAVAKLCVVYKDQLNEDTFRDKVGAVSIKLLTRTAKERRAGSMGFAEAMILEYNGKKKSPGARLAMNRLYAKDVSLWVEPDEDDEFTEEEYEAEDILEDEDDESPALF